MPSATRVAFQYLHKKAEEEPNPLDGLPKRKVTALVNRAIQRARTGGFFRDNSWVPVHRIFKSLQDEGIPYVLMSAEYGHDKEGRPSHKVWKFEVEFLNENGRPAKVYGSITASGAGTVEDPLGVYDVTAYAN